MDDNEKRGISLQLFKRKEDDTYSMKVFRLLRYLALLFAGSTLIALAACAPQTTNVSTDTASFHTTVKLIHSPTGTGDLSWNAISHVLMVHVTATGLAPNSTHPEHIHAGTCSNMGSIVYALAPLEADAHGVGTSETAIRNVMDGIPASGWSINIHNGPTLTPELEARSVACGTIFNAGASVASNQHVSLPLLGTMAPDENVHGTAQIGLEKKKLTITLTLSGLAPNTTHIAHIHTGSCAAQGPVMYALEPIIADAQGNARATTTIGNVTHFLPSQMYINVHEAGAMALMSTSQGFNPLVCGNI